MPPDWQDFGYTLNNFDPTILAVYAQINELFPGTYVNVRDGKRIHNWCGLRSSACTVGAAKSAHKIGKALDLHHVNLQALRAWCTSEAGLAAGIKRVEAQSATPTWVHIDVCEPPKDKWSDKTRPYVFLP
jgi:hypothetical protein